MMNYCYLGFLSHFGLGEELLAATTNDKFQAAQRGGEPLHEFSQVSTNSS